VEIELLLPSKVTADISDMSVLPVVTSSVGGKYCDGGKVLGKKAENRNSQAKKVLTLCALSFVFEMGQKQSLRSNKYATINAVDASGPGIAHGCVSK
jgi:hypothetical protein